jgi:hypothetical protein
MQSNIPGFSRDIIKPDAGCFAIFGGEGSGKTRLCSTATEWADARGKIPGWIICDRKSRKTIKDVHAELGLTLPFMNPDDFVTQKQAMALAVNTNYDVVKREYEDVVKRLFDSVVTLAARPDVEPIILDSGSTIWDWIAYSHFGRKQEVGKSRVWGPPKSDFTDLMDAVSNKLCLITFKGKDEYRNDSRTGRLTIDGPPHTGYCVTSVIRCNFNPHKQVDYYWDKFSLDVVESQDNVGLAGVDSVLGGQDITIENLMAQLRPGE